MSHKVDVITKEQAKFSKWCWWSDWVDICLFSYGEVYLLQMKVSRTNAKKFKSIRLAGTFAFQEVRLPVDLTQMGKTNGT